eukprot:CAMPEP_0185034110 /NCGR_PEP_ID=MMETSP1103-20130426/23687_1 /TAXON_ID=36769 /ORGANISM="Paraphysomonas bandaiensis, Strain Caron Lab Isolate" /LENGTH=811 /DNA_ID=CAMNT_0027570633 /DNA_START=15 /DNA_END=2450 /DNA_ORIENTATION=+
MPLFLDRIAQWANSQPNKTAWTFLNDKSEPIDSYTYMELERITSTLAVHLTCDCGLQPGDRAMLVFFPGLHFMISLVACFKAGVIAVPVFPPDPRKQKKDLHHFISIQSNSGANIALTHTMYNFAKRVADIKNIFSSKGEYTWPDLKWITIDNVISKAKQATSHPAVSHVVRGDDTAFLQYTSGSTSEPKGVMISHNNLAHNEMLIAQELETTPETVCVSWLPQYHDMGLIGSYLGCAYCGGSGYYLSPISFLKDPTQWVRALSIYKASHTQAPNFAFALVTRKFKEASPPITDLDLSSVRHMINAAEPVDAVALDQFCNVFAGFGLSPGVIYPTYGLAEHTVFVCSGGKQRLIVEKESLEGRSVHVVHEHMQFPNSDNSTPTGESKGYCDAVEAPSDKEGLVAEPEVKKDVPTAEIVGCGYPSKGQDVDLLIVDPDTGDILADDKIGEIWVNSPSKAMGYWNMQELSRHDFHASPTHATNSNTYLRTGDLGFMHRNELFICGRLKDLIIVRGSNHYPQDIERTAESCNSQIRPGCSAAFAVSGSNDAHTEGVVYVAEVRDGASADQLNSILEAVRYSVSSDHGVALQCVVLIKSRTVPKTTSGKIARTWCRRAYMEGSLQILAKWEAPPGQQNTNYETGGESTINVEDSAVNNGKAIGEDNTSVAQDGNLEIDGLVQQTSSADEIRSLTIEEIEGRLEEKLMQISSSGPTGPLAVPVDRGTSMASMGLDSMSIVQFKGVIENRFYCEFPDEFMFTQRATIHELAMAVKNGGLTSSQRMFLESSSADPNEGGTTTIIEQKQPFCPWFTCCY